MSNFSLRRGTACYSLYCDLSGVHRVRPSGSTRCHCCAVTGRVKARLKCLLCRVFFAPLCRGTGAEGRERIKGNQHIFFFFNSIKSSSGSRDVKEHEIQNVLTPVPVKRSYLCSRGLQILFFFLECFPPVTWCYYACWARQCQRVNTHRIVMEGHWRRLWAGPDQFVIVFKMNLLLTLLAAVVNTH